MSRNQQRSQKLDLKLNLSLLPTRPGDDLSAASPHGGYLSSPSASSSCLSMEPDLGGLVQSPISPADATSTSMVLAGCPRCLMYVMLAEDDVKCPKCGSAVLLDFFHGAAGGGTAVRSNKHNHKKTRMS